MADLLSLFDKDLSCSVSLFRNFILSHYIYYIIFIAIILHVFSILHVLADFKFRFLCHVNKLQEKINLEITKINTRWLQCETNLG